MMAFDKHDSIIYQDLSHMYWGLYPYKILIPFESPLPKYSNKRRAAKKTLEDEIQKPKDDIEYRGMVTTTGFSYFFLNEANALEFIDNNSSIISVVWRPHHPLAVELLADEKIRLRQHLFWAKYQWCVTFNPRLKTDDLNNVDDWISSHFDGDDNGGDRLQYNYGQPRKLYLSDDSDLLTVKVSVGEFVTRVERAVLFENV